MITQRPEETDGVDRILLMDAGLIVADGTPREVLSDAALLRRSGLRPPFSVRLWNEIRDLMPGPEGDCPMNLRELAGRICH